LHFGQTGLATFEDFWQLWVFKVDGGGDVFCEKSELSFGDLDPTINKERYGK
jgi:hypothetical protein